MEITSAHDMASDRLSSIQYRAGDYGVNANVLVRSKDRQKCNGVKLKLKLAGAA